jgi:hypothetical protein
MIPDDRAYLCGSVPTFRGEVMKGYRAYANKRVRHLIQCSGVRCVRVRGTAGKVMWSPLWALVVVDWVCHQMGTPSWEACLFKRWPKALWRTCSQELHRLNNDRDALYAFLAEMVLRFGGEFFLGIPARFALEEGIPEDR